MGENRRLNTTELLLQFDHRDTKIRIRNAMFISISLGARQSDRLL